MSASEKWTPARIAALRRTIEAARRYVRCADEFVPADGSHFYPDALGEYADELVDAIDADGRAWDVDPGVLQPLDFRREALAPVAGFTAPGTIPAARVIRTG